MKSLHAQATAALVSVCCSHWTCAFALGIVVFSRDIAVDAGFRIGSASMPSSRGMGNTVTDALWGTRAHTEGAQFQLPRRWHCKEHVLFQFFRAHGFVRSEILLFVHHICRHADRKLTLFVQVVLLGKSHLLAYTSEFHSKRSRSGSVTSSFVCLVP